MSETTSPKHPVRRAVIRGWRRRCPHCGQGPIMSGYLKVRDNCPVCREDLSHHRADDGPAYLTILIVGHVMAPGLHFAFVAFRPDPLVLFTLFAIGSVTLALFLLPRLKGAIVGYQWAKGMGGFARREALQSDITHAVFEHDSTHSPRGNLDRPAGSG